MALAWIRFRFPGVSNVECAFQILVPNGEAVPQEADTISLDPAQPHDKTVRNRFQILEELALHGFAENRQVHGTTTIFDPLPQKPEEPSIIEGDGLVTQQQQLGLLIKTADCQPILLTSTSGDFVAALHVGWKGNRLHYPQIAVQAVCSHFGLSPATLMAVRGPSLGPAAAEFINFEREWGEEFRPWFDPHTQTMNLWNLTRAQLQEAGIPSAQIYGLDLCTYTLGRSFFSYRNNRNCGRQASLIWLK